MGDSRLSRFRTPSSMIRVQYNALAKFSRAEYEASHMREWREMFGLSRVRSQLIVYFWDEVFPR